MVLHPNRNWVDPESCVFAIECPAKDTQTLKSQQPLNRRAMAARVPHSALRKCDKSKFYRGKAVKTYFFIFYLLFRRESSTLLFLIVKLGKILLFQIFHP